MYLACALHCDRELYNFILFTLYIYEYVLVVTHTVGVFVSNILLKKKKILYALR